MPEYLPLQAFRQGLLAGDCGACAWWQTSGAAVYRGVTAEGRRREWLEGLEHEWGPAGLLLCDSAEQRGSPRSADVAVIASIHFAPASALPRFRELPFPPLPPFSALLICLHTAEGAPAWAAKRIIRKALAVLRGRGVDEVYAVAYRGGNGNGSAPSCRFLPAELLADNGFAEVAGNGRFCLMKVDNRGLISLIDQVEVAIRRLFPRREDPAPSPAAWAQEASGAGQRDL
jgi:hypothetical protein